MPATDPNLVSDGHSRGLIASKLHHALKDHEVDSFTECLDSGIRLYLSSEEARRLTELLRAAS